jgi:hypothetical protein
VVIKIKINFIITFKAYIIIVELKLNILLFLENKFNFESLDFSLIEKKFIKVKIIFVMKVIKFKVIKELYLVIKLIVINEDLETKVINIIINDIIKTNFSEVLLLIKNFEKHIIIAIEANDYLSFNIELYFLRFEKLLFVNDLQCYCCLLKKKFDCCLCTFLFIFFFFFFRV